MVRLIDANALWESAETCRETTGAFQTLIESAPTVDAVQVVRCGKCERRYKPLDDDARNEIYCEFIGSMMRKDDFCSRGCADGERRD